MNDSSQKSQMANELSRKDVETTHRLKIINNIAETLASGDYTVRLNEDDKDTMGSLSGSLNKMAAALDKSFQAINANQWLQKGIAGIGEKLAGEKTIEQLSEESITFIAEYTSSQVGAIFLVDSDNKLVTTGGYALPAQLQNNRFNTAEGLAGQSFTANREIWVKDISDDLYTNSSIGSIKPRQILLAPILFEGRPTGVIEIGTMTSYTHEHFDYLSRISELIGISINTATNRLRLKELLEETQAQSEELQAQHSELENINAELEIQTEKLQASEEELKVQQEELMEANQELEERSRLLEEKNHLVVVRNLEIQKKADELLLSTRYKSEFLANMSHELRTPLNSILLLSRLLSENNDKNLSGEQVEFAEVIQSSGQGLLQLIDEILDLSKIESGKLVLEYEHTRVGDVMNQMRLLFNPMAADKKVEFIVDIAGDVPPVIETDKQRLEQILKNLVSNALKFTPSGKIELSVALSKENPNTVDFSVTDSGIGVPEEKQQLIFEAFQQADGSTKRKYGGTGLGLSISRQLARLLGGDISLHSEPGKGSRFTLSIPLFKMKQVEIKPTIPVVKLAPPAEAPETPKSPYIATDIPTALPDDRKQIVSGDKVILVVEDDIIFAKTLLDFASKKGYKTLHVVRGDEVIDHAVKYRPTGILLDIQLPVMDGLTVMDELKKDIRTRHIPVHIMSSFEAKKESLRRGAVDFIDKPVLHEQMAMVLQKIEQVVTTGQKKVLIVEDNSYHAKALAYFLSTHNVTTQISDDIQKSMDELQKKEVNCVILDMGLPGQKAYETLEAAKQNQKLEHVPIIIFTGQSLSRSEEQRIRQYADTIVVKTAHSYERLLNEVSLFLHLVHESDKKIPAATRGLGKMDEVLNNKTVLVVDDDVRNIFALTKALEKLRMKVLPAVDGKEALKVLGGAGKVDIVLMDMMMPEMDGYETISRMRNDRKWKKLPIIAVTAKAMTGDREKCLKAGASDYISKPVDTDQLMSLMRVWLYETL
jgi:signal transduction histidine kinase/DNA-binding response OmpR family regulator